MLRQRPMQKIVTWMLALASFASAQTARNQRLQQDLDTFASKLPVLHVNAFHQITRQQFNQAVNDLSSKIPSITDQQFYVSLAAITAMIGDAHTNLYLLNDGYFRSNAAAQLGFLSFPIRLRWLDDGIFVEAAAPQYSQLL